ncbi:MAG: M81 family metallopeptidase [Alphaproteobacteria bacterium]|nr:M81 family metallopeptidase [Alphaproteobacteria bacterium]
MASPRIALLGFSIECNKWSPVARRSDFTQRTWLEGDAIVADARAAAPTSLGEMPGFVRAMDAAGPWTPVPTLLCCAEPGGPVDAALFAEMMATWKRGLEAAGRLDAVYAMMHGAGLAEGEEDPDGAALAMVRLIVGPDVPVVASFDLHANVSARMVDSVDVFVGYRTNPHLDMRERGEECARHVRALLAGKRTARSFIRLPIIPPTVTMLTAPAAPLRPYGEMIDLGQRRIAEPPYAGRILNVSVMGGFAYADTSKNGLAVIVSAERDAKPLADALAREIAELGWRNREKFRARLTSLADATAIALAASRDAGLPARCFADVADNPGGGARGNTMWILEAFHAAGVSNALIGVINDPALAAEAHRLGVGARFTARFNRDEPSEFSKPFAATATVRALTDGRVTGRRGIFAGTRIDLGPSAAIDIGGITAVVITQRTQCADPIFFESFGLDIAKARVVIVKSRGHFRGGFDEFFDHGQIVEVDCPGLTSPVLSRFPWARLQRPVLPIDDGVTWTPPASAA